MGFGRGIIGLGSWALGVGMIRGAAIEPDAVDGREFWSKDYGRAKCGVCAIDFVSGG